MVVVRQACNVASVNLLQATFNKKSFTKWLEVNVQQKMNKTETKFLKQLIYKQKY